jgi:hypothetical protein
MATGFSEQLIFKSTIYNPPTMIVSPTGHIEVVQIFYHFLHFLVSYKRITKLTDYYWKNLKMAGLHWGHHELAQEVVAVAGLHMDRIKYNEEVFMIINA